MGDAGVAVVSGVHALPLLCKAFDQVKHRKVAVEQRFPTELMCDVRIGVVVLIDAPDQVTDQLLIVHSVIIAHITP
ncbi:hypothetical protein AMIS_25290 [Actinoplanes missouriensis 431]|uniref:Uncharacterized protein n=1 Tax=Actinoplanes missouriensis (strain ATCC 14538 / DSM 43046 / CBS 188.64 / JCM 3121 / NBRC 102363 / NCIMB 12654 / NRRL B-3342 / UNCC 431) TaxID=512565 RepID=I0H412_ACTM4|nr:hypothetical protein AMIS_25290 [Actinoplanes missouriensis 431]